MTVTAVDVVTAATDAVEGIENGTLTPAGVQRRAVDACRELFGIVGTEGDPLWPLHADTTRQFLAAGGMSAAELGEWLAVQQRREAEADDGP